MTYIVEDITKIQKSNDKKVVMFNFEMSYNALTNPIVYDSDLRPTSVTVPGVERLAFSYDEANRITGITNGMDATNSETR